MSSSGPEDHGSVGTGRAVVRSAAVAGVVLGLAGVSLAAADGGLARLMQTPEPVVAPSFGVVAALLAAHPHARRIGALLAATALLAGVYVASSAAVAHGGAPPALAWLSVWTWVPALGLVVAVLPGVVPDGLPLRGRWRQVTTAAYAVVVAGSGLAMVAPREVPREPGRSNPGGLDLLDRWVEPLGLALAAAGVALTLLQLVSLVVRHRRASGQERRQVAWFGYGVAGTVLATLVAPSEVRALAVLLVPAAILVAATRYRLYEIDRLVNRTAVAAVLLAGAAVVYAAVAGWAAVLLGDGSPVASFAAAFAVAIAFHPARTRVQRLVDRLLLPERLDPHRLGLELVATARAAAGPTQALQDAAELLRRRLHARSVTLVHAGARVAAAGDRPAEPAAGPVVAPAAPAVSVIALQQHGSVVGELELVVADAAGETLVQNPAVRAAVAGPLAALMHAWTLTADLERSRESIVGAREEERRRLRRDLHDGLGPQLATITMTLDTARRVLADDRAARAGELLGAALEQSRLAVADVRTVVAGLRPPALDELGLDGALRSVGPGVLADHDASARITIETSDLGQLPAATEVAAYRIAQEAMTNAVRHAAASAVQVRLSRDSSALHLAVRDDGRGFDTTTVADGVGLHSMRERAAELGGSFRITSAPGRGTCVEAVLPDRRAER